MFNFNMSKCRDAQVKKFKTMGNTLNKLDEVHAAYHTYLSNI